MRPGTNQASGVPVVPGGRAASAASRSSGRLTARPRRREGARRPTRCPNGAKVQNAVATADHADPDPPCPDGFADGPRQLLLSAGRKRCRPAGLEDGRREPPAVHADQGFRPGGFQGRGIRLLEDRGEVSIGRHGAHGEGPDAVGLDVAVLEQRPALEERRAGLGQPAQIRERADRVIVVRVDDEKVLAAGEGFGRQKRVGRAEGTVLDRENDPDAPRRPLRRVVVAHGSVLGPDDEADLFVAGVREPAKARSRGTAGRSGSWP